MSAKVTNCLRDLRREAGMTQEELAEQVGVTRQTIISMEKGNYTPSVYLALKLSEAMEKKVEDVFDCIN